MRIDWHREKQALECLVFLIVVSLAAALLALAVEQGIASLLQRVERSPRGPPLPVAPTVANKRAENWGQSRIRSAPRAPETSLS